MSTQNKITNPALLTKCVNDFRIADPDALRPKKKGRKKTLDKNTKCDVTINTTSSSKSIDTGGSVKTKAQSIGCRYKTG